MTQEIELIFHNIRKELDMYADFATQKLGDQVSALVQLLETQPEEVRHQTLEELAGLCDESKPMCWMFLNSVVLRLMPQAGRVLDVLRKVTAHSGLTVYNKYFIYGQINNLIFNHPQLDNLENSLAKEELLQRICEEMEEKLAMELTEIPEAQRNRKLVVVITGQFLTAEHGPTKTALDRCVTLIRQMGKTVFLINTGEVNSLVGMVPFYKAQPGNYMAEHLECDKQVWKGVEIPFYQSEQIMPDVDEYRALLNHILRLRPGWIISVGGNSLLANMCRNVVPTLVVGCFPSMLEPSLMRYQTLGRPVSNYDRAYMARRSKPERYAVECVFTSGLKEQQEKLHRKDYGIPEDAFVLEIVGARLDEEVTEEFLDMLERTVRENIYVVFAGVYKSYEEKLREHPGLKEASSFLGYQKDMLAVAELCNLYVNPHRRGGGTSCVEAMSKGVPVVTTPFGDVSVNAGESFWVQDYDEMGEQILRHWKDAEYHRHMSQLARQRTELLLDSDREFVRIMHEVERRELQAAQAEEQGPFFSILMCTYNDVGLLREAVRSVQQQDMEDWELVVLDNSDRSGEPWEILSSAAQQDSRIRIYRSDRNVGWAKGASLCLDHARGKYMTFLAADDALTEGALRRVYQAARQQEPDVVWIGLEAIGQQADGTVARYTAAGERRHFDREHRTEAVRYLMEHVYYNSFCHFERIEFLRREQIDFFEPYFMDCGGMTRAMVRAETMEVLPEIGYRLTLHTSQTANHYIMGSYRMLFASQWESVTECLRAENCQDAAMWQYMAYRIGNNLLGNMTILSTGGGCRDRYMNPVTVTWEERLQELKRILSDDVLTDMCRYLGERFLSAADEALGQIISHLEGEAADRAAGEAAECMEGLRTRLHR